ncbi:MAG: glycosyltransferase [Solirubrobacteraceae bacterium]|nr:glycosyltransferase [Solirubrobacteraceae bacterium]
MTVCAIIPALSPEGAASVVEELGDSVDVVVVIDNADGAVGAALASCSPRVSVIRAESNLGFGAAVNLAARGTDAELIVILNDDVVPGQGFIAAITAPFADSDVHQAACCLLADGSGMIDSLGIAFDRTLRAADVREHHPSGTAIIGPSGAAAAYRRATFLAVGGFAPQLFAYWEDADLALRLWQGGHRCAYAGGARAYHRRGSALQGRSSRQRELDAFGRGFVLGRYAAWLSRIDRLLVAVVDWPSLVRGCVACRSIRLLASRRAGLCAGHASPVAPAGSERPAMRSVGRTLRSQIAGDVSTVDPRR